jgi:hypothetical protein
MWVEAIISQEDFTALATELFPLSVHLGASDSDHYLLLSATTAVSLVEGRGLRFTCNAQIRWPVLGMDVPINIEALTVLVEPSVPDGSESLVLGVQLEHANVSWLPALVDAKIVEAVNDALKTKSRELSWNFTKTLSHEFPLPELLRPLRALDLNVAWGKVRVTAEALVIVVSFRAAAVMTKRQEPAQSEAARSLPADELGQPARQGDVRLVHPPSVIERASPKTIVIASALVLTATYLTVRGAVRLFGSSDRPRTW